MVKNDGSAAGVLFSSRPSGTMGGSSVAASFLFAAGCSGIRSGRQCSSVPEGGERRGARRENCFRPQFSSRNFRIR